ncbi:MAG: patatin-like phospholipase family protein, partial [Actinomycetota bacterium]|nr:patatin-like phospholipase family protein [Actinomycetota bacterium]
MQADDGLITVVVVKIVIASGHLTDGPCRTTLRFPEESVSRVQAEVRRQLEDWGVGRSDLLICGGGRGADLVAAEQALELKASVRLCLPLPRDEFVARSVELAGTAWRMRFDRVVAASDVREQNLPVEGGRVFEAANEWMIGQVRDAGASDVYALVVWDGEDADRPGGAADFIERAVRAGIPLYGIDPTPRLSATRQWAPGPKRMLSLDGGGIRGVLSLGILASIEAQLRAWGGRPDLVLADYFDYIVGTSTGAIIGAALSLGKSVAEILDRYLSLGRNIFRFNWLGFWIARHPSAPLTAELNALLGAHRRLGDPELRTLLAVILHNCDTDSPWPLSNCPSARYNRPERRLTVHPERRGPHVPDRNLDLSLCDLVLGST